MSDISRRAWLKGLALFSAVAGAPSLLASTTADAKASKASVHYRDYPKGMQMCHMCKFYIGGHGGMGGMCMSGGSMMGMMGAGACQVVQGRISPMGWCDLYAPA
jgi:uncharacterized low-complexity protein